MIELEKFLSSGGSPSDIRTILRTERSKKETHNGQSEGELVGEVEAVEEAEVMIEVDMRAGAEEAAAVTVVTVEDREVCPDKTTVVPSL